MRIKRHDKSHIVELTDSSVWRLWPGDLDKTLGWLPTTDIEIVRIDHKLCSHALLSRSDGSRVKASRAGAEWPVDLVRRLLAEANGRTVAPCAQH
jgi:hypothetical protein